MEKTCKVSLTDLCTIKATISLIKQVHIACFGYDTLPQVIGVLPEEGCTTKGVFLACKTTKYGTCIPYLICTPWGVIKPFGNIEKRVLTCEQIGALRVPNFENIYKNLKIVPNENYEIVFSLTDDLTISIFEPTECSVYRDSWEELLEY